MSLNAQVSAERVHIGFFGLRNAGKSSLVNRVTGQELSVVSEVRGTTTDPVRKAMELLPSVRSLSSTRRDWMMRERSVKNGCAGRASCSTRPISRFSWWMRPPVSHGPTAA